MQTGSQSLSTRMRAAVMMRGHIVHVRVIVDKGHEGKVASAHASMWDPPEAMPQQDFVAAVKCDAASLDAEWRSPLGFVDAYLHHKDSAIRPWHPSSMPEAVRLWEKPPSVPALQRGLIKLFT